MRCRVLEPGLDLSLKGTLSTGKAEAFMDYERRSVAGVTLPSWSSNPVWTVQEFEPKNLGTPHWTICELSTSASMSLQVYSKGFETVPSEMPPELLPSPEPITGVLSPLRGAK